MTEQPNLDVSGIPRTPSGEIVDPTATKQTETPVDQTKQDTKSDDTKVETKVEDGKSLLNDGKKPDEATAGAPEKYEDFKTPEGYELDKSVVDEAGPLFKKLGLSQAQAQELVDLYAKHSINTYKQATDRVVEQNRQWADQTKALFGGKFDEARATISKALNQLGPELEGKFRSAMDELGAGNHPVFAQVLYMFAEKLTEGKPVAGNGPSRFGQGNSSRPASAAQALYPNLP